MRVIIFYKYKMKKKCFSSKLKKKMSLNKKLTIFNMILKMKLIVLVFIIINIIKVINDSKESSFNYIGKPSLFSCDNISGLDDSKI